MNWEDKRNLRYLEEYKSLRTPDPTTNLPSQFATSAALSHKCHSPHSRASSNMNAGPFPYPSTVRHSSGNTYSLTTRPTSSLRCGLEDVLPVLETARSAGRCMCLSNNMTAYGERQTDQTIAYNYTARREHVPEVHQVFIRTTALSKVS